MSKYTPPPAFTTRPTLTGSFGMAASTHWLATANAQAVLERGGNAFDAVVAGGFVLHLAEPLATISGQSSPDPDGVQRRVLAGVLKDPLV